MSKRACLGGFTTNPVSAIIPTRGRYLARAYVAAQHGTIADTESKPQIANDGQVCLCCFTQQNMPGGGGVFLTWGCMCRIHWTQIWHMGGWTAHLRPGEADVAGLLARRDDRAVHLPVHQGQEGRSGCHTRGAVGHVPGPAKGGEPDLAVGPADPLLQQALQTPSSDVSQPPQQTYLPPHPPRVVTSRDCHKCESALVWG